MPEVFMQSHLIEEASKVIQNPQILINVMSRRVRQLSQGHRALVETKPGTGYSDTALMEIIQKKVSFESTTEFKSEPIKGKSGDSGFFNKKRAA